MSAPLLRTFLIAWHFLTAIPLSRSHHDPTAHELGSSMGWYPVIGLILGGLLATGDLLFSELFSRGVNDALLIILLVALTRGLHQDGLADSLDGIAGGRTPSERLAIMRDGRIGAIGATGLVLALGLRYAGLMALSQPERLPILVCMPAVGRWSMVFGAKSAPYARDEGGLAEPFLKHVSLRELVAATVLLSVALIWMVGPIGTWAALAVAAILARTIAALSTRLLGGITGDTLGAVNEISEIIFLLAGPALLGMR